MSNTYGERFRFTIFGQSHGPAIGVTMEGIPAGFVPDLTRLQAFLDRRAPGQSALTTARKESDQVEVLSGLARGRTCGAPLTAILRNQNTRSGDYDNLRFRPRPGHADYPAQVKFGGSQDAAGGGAFSGRLTAPLCIAGGLCIQLLEQQGVQIAAHIQSIEDVEDDRFDPVDPQLDAVGRFPVLNSAVQPLMEEAILRAKARQDSVGGVIECACTGVPAGWGDPMFGGMENRISQAVFGIPAIRGLEFGTGFAAAGLRGSSHNDPYYYNENGEVRTRTNHHGGILGGITTGMPVLFRVCVKPTPSIGLEQDTVDLQTGENVKLVVQGRHDPCIVPRAVPVVEAAAAVALWDGYLCARN